MLKVLIFVIVSFSVKLYAAGKLISISATNEHDILRLELNFDQFIEPNAVNTQFNNKSVTFSLSDITLKKKIDSPEVKTSFINNISLKSGNDKFSTLEIELKDIKALQMKENIALETLGKTLIIEILPPNLQSHFNSNKEPSTVSENKNHSTAGLPSKLENSDMTKDSLASSEGEGATAASQELSSEELNSTKSSSDEAQTPVFKNKVTPTADNSGVTKIILMVLAVVGLGAYLIWFLKSKSKMVNGPESLMKIKMVTQFHLGPKKTLAVVRVAGESLLLAITDSQITLLKTLSLLDEELPDFTPSDFEQTLEEEAAPRAKSQASFASKNKNVDSQLSFSEEEFSFGPAVKTSLTSKIPGLRKII